MIYLNHPNFLLEWIPDGKWLKLEHRGFIGGEEYRSAMEKALEVVIARGATRMLWDLYKMKVLAAEDQAWLENNWVKRLLSRSNVRYCAVIVPESTIAQLTIKSLNDRTVQVLENELARVYFSSPEDAERWLRSTIG
jgi:hypothetical protein